MNPTLQEIGSLLRASDASSDKHYYGQIQRVNTDVTGKVTSYEVSLGGSSDTMTCRKLAGAKIGDTVMVTLMANGVAVVTGTVGGDTDAADAAAIATDVQARADAGEFDGADGTDAASITSVTTQWCLSTSNATFSPPAGASWSEDIPAFVSGTYYWTRTVTAYADGTTTTTLPVYARSAQSAAEANDVATSMNNHFWYDANGAHVSKAEKSTATGAAVTMGASGIIQTMNGKMISSQTASGAVYYQSDGQTKMAEYGADGAEIYSDGLLSVHMAAGGMTIYGNDGTSRYELAHIGYGNGTSESGSSSKAPYFTFGNRTGTIGNFSVAEGAPTHTSEGSTFYPQASGYASHAEGASKTTTAGQFAHAEGARCIASGVRSHAEGNMTTASAEDAHAEGYSTTSAGRRSHAEGNGTKTSAADAHAEGNGSTASGNYSHAEGMETTASGDAAHAEGGGTVASGNYSHAGGFQTIAAGSNQTAIGAWNKQEYGQYFLIGGGASEETRKNIFKVSSTGDLTLQDHASPVGTVKTASLADAKSVSSGTAAALCSITLEPGVWMVVCGVRFPANSAGYRRANLSQTSGATDQNVQMAASPSGVTQLNFTRICQPEETTRYYLNAMHNAGSALSMPAGGSQSGNYINAVRIV